MLRLDHLIFVAPELESGMAHLEQRLGVRASSGGRHEGRGTHNALLSLGEGRYLEILAPDPDQPTPPLKRFLNVSEQTPYHLATWVASGTNLGQIAERARRLGVELGMARAGGRRRPDGSMLTWNLLGVDEPRMDGTVPFFIDWGASPHPSTGATLGCVLLDLRLEHPEPPRLRAALAGLDLELQVDLGNAPALIATIECPRGVVELR